MALISRRDVGKLLIGGSAGLWAVSRKGWSAPYIDSVVRGVQIGAQSYSFRDMGLDAAIEAFKTVGLGECELFDGHVVPSNIKEQNRRNGGFPRLPVLFTRSAPSSIMAA